MTDTEEAAAAPIQPELARLWSGPVHWFSEWPSGDVPGAGSLVYTIWDRSGLFVYVGISRRSAQMSPRSNGRVDGRGQEGQCLYRACASLKARGEWV